MKHLEDVILSTQKGHRWVRGERIWVVCIDCGERWPVHGDIAPMPACSGGAAVQP